MPKLEKLSPELKEALGTMSNLVSRYETLREKTESLRDDAEAIQYVDDVIKRYSLLKKTSPAMSAAQAKKEAFLPQLRKHAGELCSYSFSKPGDLANRLKELDFTPSEISEASKGLEQAGGDDELCCCLVGSSLALDTILSCLNNGSHHHGHPHAHMSYGHGHGHSHW
ncbi:coiled coil protein [Legionella wadsworthii]|uniref:Coiled coil protein n=1 Tax=Legionella wadsworthii TaxID=28088 RepID=A0A378LPM8_9GAMM|nr:hypothetical protein [Legionella wadsworthii]STY28723.1 coiled coil protein [Legionella wadsworthii]